MISWALWPPFSRSKGIPFSHVESAFSTVDPKGLGKTCGTTLSCGREIPFISGAELSCLVEMTRCRHLVSSSSSRGNQRVCGWNTFEEFSIESRAMDRSPYTVNFDSLRVGKLGLSAGYGTFLAEGAAVCLYKNHHHSPSDLVLTLDASAIATLLWNEVGSELDATWADLKEAAEYGAYAVAIVVCLQATNLTRVERCAQEGTGIDIWLTNNRDDRGIFQHSARLEVSGILQGDQRRIAARLKDKLNQTKKSDDTEVPAYVAIVEFGSPEMRMTKRGGETISE
jgi:hypothetical protein